MMEGSIQDDMYRVVDGINYYKDRRMERKNNLLEKTMVSHHTPYKRHHCKILPWE
jgi:hypothetical protein